VRDEEVRPLPGFTCARCTHCRPVRAAVSSLQTSLVSLTSDES
jgi:hypothetical protein